MNNDLNTEIKVNIEKHWKDEVVCRSAKKHDKKTYYVLPMFPYPSGNLHMGHVRVYSISDTIARFQKLNEKNVIHPMGWDAFGLPAENAAIERNIAPDHWTQTNIQTMKRQLNELAFNFDWEREISTCDPNYYKWTQFIYLKLFEKGLAYQDEALVNWDPVDKTVLADEQVDDGGCSWRSGAKVEKKFLKQWFIKTTAFAKDLYDGLSNKNLENWNDIINLQKHWIGECNGASVFFEIQMNDTTKRINVWTSEPFKFIHGSFLTLKQDHVYLRNLSNTPHLKLTAINPITNSAMPVHVTDNAPYAEGQNVYIACPESNEEDLELAKNLNIAIQRIHRVIDKDTDSEKAINIARLNNVGGYLVSSKLKDWLISRQRYWGTPIPIIHCRECGAVPVPYEDLPVQLPKIVDFRSGIQTLKEMEEWVKCRCPRCHSEAKRETDTMDTFVDSSWYYFRFLDPRNRNLPFDKNNIIDKTPVNLYVGGKEHAVLHLYYARFMAHFLYSLGWTCQAEPFKKLLVQGMVMGQSFKMKSTGKYIKPDQIYKDGDIYKDKESDEPVLMQWEKMSKSKYNGENPEKLLTEYGCDTTRLFMLADVPPATSRNWSDATFPGVLNWQHRLWITMRDFLNLRSNQFNKTDTISEKDFKAAEAKLADSRNYFIATTTFHFMHTQKLSVGISRLQGLTNSLRSNVPAAVVAGGAQFELALAQLVTMLAPAAPHFACELWAALRAAPRRRRANEARVRWAEGVFDQPWPKVDDDFPLSFLCKVDGKDTCDLKIKSAQLSAMSEAEAVQMMLEQESVKKRLSRGLAKTKYELYPGCRAILHLYVHRKKQVEKLAV